MAHVSITKMDLATIRALQERDIQAGGDVSYWKGKYDEEREARLLAEKSLADLRAWVDSCNEAL